MNVFEFVVIIVAIGAIARVLKARYRAHAPGRDVPAAADDEVRRLRERIQVLERVITDNHGSHDLDRQIERLRDR